MRGEPTQFWGKLTRTGQGPVEEWHPLIDHCADVAACIFVLLSDSLLGSRLARLAGLESLAKVQVARVSVLAALHDVGKFNHGFQNKAARGAATTAGHVAEVLNLLASTYPERERLCEVMKIPEILEWADSPEAVEALLCASISHHGRPVHPERDPKRSLWVPQPDRDPIAGVAELVACTVEWFGEAWESTGPPLPDEPRFQHALSGLVMLADWFGSDRRFFPFTNEGDTNRFASSLERAREAMGRVAILAASSRKAFAELRPDFQTTFGFSPRGAQRTILELEVRNGPSLTILEAETGSGKTEAALARYFDLFRAGVVDGLYFALPTRTAATQLHRRVAKAIERSFPDKDVRPPVVLAVPGYLSVDDRTGTRLPGFEVLWNDDDHERFRYRGWAAEHPKRYLAGAVVVGTIDQVLLSTLTVNHSHMRGAALLRQFLVVDEVHASDAYMNRLLESVLERHWAAGGHSLLMSATLGSTARSLFLGAAGKGQDVPGGDAAASLPYPAVLQVESDDSRWLRPTGESRGKQVRVTLDSSADKSDLIAELAVDAANRGAKVLVVRNTVTDCVATQQAVEVCARNTGATDLLFSCAGVPAPHHSRFARADRLALDHALESLFGGGSAATGCVVSATQTVQQSLDIDADLLITDLCPMDVLLQRIGRLHRHDRARPSGFEEPNVRVLSPNTRDLTPFIRRGGRARGPHGLGTVYEDLRILEATWRTLERNNELDIPRMNRHLVESAMHPSSLREIVSDSPQAWNGHADWIHGSNLADRRMARRNLSDWSEDFLSTEFPSRELDQRIQTRLGEGDRLVDFIVPAAGPFGQLVRRLTIPAWLARGAPSETAVEDLQVTAGEISFQFGCHRFVYDRLGLRREGA